MRQFPISPLPRILASLLSLMLGICSITPASEPQDTPFAADRGGPNEVQPIRIDSKRAMKYLRQICDIGPRMSGTKGMTAQQELLRKHFTALGAKVRLQKFTAKQVTRANPVAMANMIVSWNPDTKRRVILCSHYDTRPIADQERDPRKWRQPFVSANDGGSGVAFLMELGHHMKKINPKVGVDFVFFDGEEYIFNADRDRYFFGSKHFAKAWRKDRNRPQYQAAILLDMIAGKNPRFPAEGYSFNRARPLAMQIWQIAGQQGCAAFQNRVGDHVLDDHLALLNAGIPTIDIIDFSYRHWHKLSDTPANCSPEGFDQVGRVLTVWLQELR